MCMLVRDQACLPRTLVHMYRTRHHRISRVRHVPRIVAADIASGVAQAIRKPGGLPTSATAASFRPHCPRCRRRALFVPVGTVLIPVNDTCYSTTVVVFDSDRHCIRAQLEMTGLPGFRNFCVQRRPLGADRTALVAQPIWRHAGRPS